MTDTKNDALVALQIEIQKSFNIVIKNTEKLASDNELSLQDLAYNFGSAVASSFYEIVRGDDQTHGFTVEQGEAMKACVKFIIDGFYAKCTLISNPEEMKNIVIQNTVH